MSMTGGAPIVTSASRSACGRGHTCRRSSRITAPAGVFSALAYSSGHDHSPSHWPSCWRRGCRGRVLRRRRHCGGARAAARVLMAPIAETGLSRRATGPRRLRRRRARSGMQEMVAEALDADQRPRRRGAGYQRHMATDQMHPVLRLFPYLRRYLRLAGLSVAATLVAVAVGLLVPWPLKIVIDSVLGSQPLQASRALGRRLRQHTLLVAAVSAGLILTLLANALAVASSYLKTRLEQASFSIFAAIFSITPSGSRSRIAIRSAQDG